MPPLRFGLIGCGQLGRTHAQCVGRLDGAAFVAYADTHLPSAQALLTEFGGDYATSDTQRILADPNVQAIYICTRHDSHAPLAVAAAQAGKHVFIEKPLALSAHDCERIAQAVEQSGVFLMPGFKMRYYPLVQRAKEFIPSPQVLVGQMMDNRWPDHAWAQDPVQGGANVHSQGCHTTDLLRYLAGSEPQTLWAAGGTMTHPGHPCIDQCVAAIRFENGCIASWIQGDASESKFTSKFFFELFANGRSVQLHNRFKSAVFFDGKETWTETRDDEEGFLLENQEFIAALREARKPAIDAYDGLQATRMVLAADAAIRTAELQSFTSPRA